MTFTAISLFSGAVDGLAIAAQAAGIKVTHHVEWDAWCCRVLRMNHPDAIVLNEDIHDVHDLPPADIIFGGSPCQGWSAAGNQLGFDDPRYLWPEMLRIVRESKPRVVIHENVRGGVSKGLLDKICDDLEGAGYTTKALVFPANVFGAPHKRERFITIGLMAHHKNDNDRRIGERMGHTSQKTGKQNVWPVIDRHAKAMGYPEINRLETYDYESIGSNQGFDNFKSYGAGAQGRIYQPGMGRVDDGITPALHRLDPITDFPGFPAGQGIYQHAYEPARTTPTKSKYAKERIQALGNAVVWQQAAPVMRTVVRWLSHKLLPNAGEGVKV